jgi:hypothetical protein
MLLLGVLAAQAEAAAPAAAGSYDLLETEILTGTQASVTFSSLNSTYGADYQHLQIRYVARTDKTGDPDNYLHAQFNNVTSSSYASHQLQGNGSSVTSSALASQTYMRLANGSLIGAGASAGAFSASVIDILDPFETTKNTTARALTGISGGVTYSYVINLSSGVFLSTAAITEIDLFPLSGNFVADSRFSLYGLKASA